MMPQFTLYHYYRSSCSWRVRWALSIKGLSAQLVPINLLAGEQTSPPYLAKNPLGQVPCLEINGDYFGESLAMLEWLDEIAPTPALLPQDPLSRLRVRGLSQIISSGTQPLQNLGVQRFHSGDAEGQRSFARHWITRGLAAYERQLVATGSAGTYSFGAELTMADLCLVPQCFNAERFSVELSSYPTVQGIYQRCLALPSCQDSAPARY